MNKLSKKKSKNIINYICKAPKSILLFTADWCHACKEINVLFDDVSNKLNSECYFKKINIDNELFESITLQYKIVTIPTLTIITNGKIKNTISNINKDVFNNIIKTELNTNNVPDKFTESKCSVLSN